MFIVHVHCSLFMFIVHCSHGATLIFDDVFFTSKAGTHTYVIRYLNKHAVPDTRKDGMFLVALWARC